MLAGPGCALVEFGSGSSVKSRLLLEGLRDLSAYVPIDISRQHLDATAARLRRDYPGLKVEPVCADYMALTDLPADVNGAPRLGFFPGLDHRQPRARRGHGLPAPRPFASRADRLRW